MIKAVLYDLGDIFFEAHFWRRWMWKEIMKITGKRWTFREFYELYESWIKKVYTGKAGYEDNYRNFLKSLNIKNADEFLARSFKKKKYVEENRKLFPGVKKTLKRLKECDIMIIVMTDNEKTEAGVRKEVLKRFSIDHLIDKVYTSLDVKTTKPAPSFFSKILSDLRLGKTEVIFVGHDIDEINGAKKFGLQVIEFNNYLKYKTEADHRISSFSRIFEIIPNL